MSLFALVSFNNDRIKVSRVLILESLLLSFSIKDLMALPRGVCPTLPFLSSSTLTGRPNILSFN